MGMKPKGLKPKGLKPKGEYIGMGIIGMMVTPRPPLYPPELERIAVDDRIAGAERKELPPLRPPERAA
jgi:hypothetical protein